MDRFRVRIEEGTRSGGLYELEFTRHYYIDDTKLETTLYVGSCLCEASMDTSGDWGDGSETGIVRVVLAPSQEEATVFHSDGSTRNLRFAHEVWSGSS